MMKYFDGNCTDSEYEALEKHICECSGCKEEFEKLSDIFTVLAEDGKLEPAADFEVKVMEKVNAISSACRTDRKYFALVYSIAAFIVSAVSIALFFEIRSMNIFEFIDRIYLFSAFISGMGMALGNIFHVLTGVIRGFLRIFLETVFTVVKNYYYIFTVILLMTLAIQKIIISSKKQEGGLQK